MNGFTIATEPRRASPRTQSTTSSRRQTATPPRKGAPARKQAVPRQQSRQQLSPRKPPAPRNAVSRSRRAAVPRYRPNYWLVAAVSVVFAVLAVAFLVTIAILWSLTGPSTTVIMVAVYVVAMYALWRVGISRL